MINFPIFVEGLLMPLILLGVFVVYKRSKRKKRKFHAPPTNQLPSWLHLTRVTTRLKEYENIFLLYI